MRKLLRDVFLCNEVPEETVLFEAEGFEEVASRGVFVQDTSTDTGEGWEDGENIRDNQRAALLHQAATEGLPATDEVDVGVGGG